MLRRYWLKLVGVVSAIGISFGLGGIAWAYSSNYSVLDHWQTSWCSTYTQNNGYCAYNRTIPLRVGGQNYSQAGRGSGWGWRHIAFEHLNTWNEYFQNNQTALENVIGPELTNLHGTPDPYNQMFTRYQGYFINTKQSSQWIQVRIVVNTSTAKGEVWPKGIWTVYPISASNGLEEDIINGHKESQLPEWLAVSGGFAGSQKP